MMKQLKSFPGAFKRVAALSLAVVILGAALCTPAAGAELYLNGSFEAGNTSFGSDLGFVANPPIGANQNGVYAIATNPSLWFPYPPTWSNMGDHTTGSGEMLLATPNPGTARIWFETVNAVAGQSYTFSGWAAHVSTDDPNIARLSINAQGTSLGVYDLSVLPQGIWGRFSFNYTAASSGPLIFSITDLATDTYGNDFVLDDLSFAPVPEPGSMAMLVPGAAVLMIFRRRK